jgi:hypothetical protein
MHRILNSVIFAVSCCIPSFLYSQSFFECDAGFSSRFWFPQNPDQFTVTTTGYQGYYVNGALRWGNLLRLYRFRYEVTNNLERPHTKDLKSYLQEKTGTLGYYILSALGDVLRVESLWNASLVLRMDQEQFLSDVVINEQIRYYPYFFDGNKANYYTYRYGQGKQLRFATVFDDMFFGVGFGQENERLYIGIGRTLYQKPYSYHIGSLAMDSLLFDAKFTGTTFGIGVELATDKNPQRGLGISAFYSMGNGDVELVKDYLSISNIAEKYHGSVMYYGIEARLQYRFVLISDMLFFGCDLHYKGKMFRLHSPDDKSISEEAEMNTDNLLGVAADLRLIF